MNNTDWNQICSIYGLGKLTHDPKPVTGGLLHKVWKLKTTKGDYAVKILNPEIARRHTAEIDYHNSEKIAAMAAAHDLPAISAILLNRSPITKINGSTILLYRWSSGKIMNTETISASQAETIGTLLARLHRLNIELPNLTFSPFRKIDKAQWEKHLTHGTTKELDWVTPATEMLENLTLWSNTASKTQQNLSKNLVVSHRDLDPKNVLWVSEKTPYLLDWESAGLINPTVDLMTVAQDWSDLHNLELFDAVVRGYKNAGGKLTDDPKTAFDGSLGPIMEWLDYNMRRSYDKQFGPEEQLLGAQEVHKSLTRLNKLIDHKYAIINSLSN